LALHRRGLATGEGQANSGGPLCYSKKDKGLRIKHKPFAMSKRPDRRNAGERLRTEPFQRRG